MLSQFLVAIAIAGQAGGSASEWKAYPSAKGKFSVAMPAKPAEKKRVLAISGKTVEYVTATARKGLATYTASFAELGGADPQAAAKVAQEDVLAQSKGDLKEERDVPLGSMSGHELAIEIPRKVVAGGANQTARIYLLGGRIYVLTAMVPTAKAEALAEDVAAFFDSFKPQGVDLDAPADATPPGTTTTEAKSAPTLKSGDGKGMAAKGADAKGMQSKSLLGSLAGLNPLGTRPPASAPAVGRDGDGLPKGLGAGWKMFTPEVGGYSIAMPGDPKPMTVKTPTPAGQVEVLGHAVEGPKGVFVILTNGMPGGAAIPEAATQAVLDQIKIGVPKGFPGAKVVDEKKIEHLGFPGRDLTVEIPKGRMPEAKIMHLRVLIAKGRLYQLQAVVPAAGGGATEEEIAAYHSSLKFKG